MNTDRAAELLAMLCARVEKYEPSIATFGALRREDVNLALALVHNLPGRLLVRIKYNDDGASTDILLNQFIGQVERGLLQHIVEFAAPERWKVPRKDFLRDMCRLSLVESISPNLCWVCQGVRDSMTWKSGSYDVDGKWNTCPECNGAGHRRPSEAKRAHILGVKVSAWKMSWSRRYQILLDEWGKAEAIVLGGMAKRLSA